MFKLGLNPYFEADEVISIGDIHSGLSKLQRLWNNLIPISPRTHVVFTGDLLDRGPEVFEVLNFILNLKKQYPGQIFIIEGNHDRSLRNYLYPEQINPPTENFWLVRANHEWINRYGGKETVAALKKRYQSEDIKEIRSKFESEGYWKIFEDMIPYYESPTIFISHAPVDGFYLYFARFQSNEDETTESFQQKIIGIADDLVDKLRRQFSEEVNLKVANYEEFNLGKTFICGHQSSGNPEPRIIGNRVFLDVSNYNELYAYYSNSKKIVSSKQ